MNVTVHYSPTEFKADTFDPIWTWYCQHLDIERVELDFGYLNHNIGDYVDSWRVVDVCQDCNEVMDED